MRVLEASPHRSNHPAGYPKVSREKVEGQLGRLASSPRRGRLNTVGLAGSASRDLGREHLFSRHESPPGSAKATPDTPPEAPTLRCKLITRGADGSRFARCVPLRRR